LVAQWLTEQKLPKCGNAHTSVWTDRNVLALIKRTVYRGWDTYRVTFRRKERRSGKHKQVHNKPDLVLTRPMEHLRIVPDSLWYAANEAIKERTLCEPSPRGLDHPLAGIPRDSRGPLSGMFFCAVCRDGKMYQEGRATGGYRCSNVPKGACWNKATALKEIVHEHLGQAIVGKLLSLDGVLDAAVDYVRELFQDDQPRQARRAELVANIKGGELGCQRLLDAIEQGKEPPVMFLDRLRQRQDEVARNRAALEHLDAQPASCPPPTKQQILDQIAVMAKQILEMDREAGSLLKRLVSPIRAVPCQQYGSNKVVLRAKFDLRLAALLPEHVLAGLRGTYDGPLADRQMVIPMTVDLFDRPAGPRHFAEALRLSTAGYTLLQIGQELGIAKRQAHIAVQYGKALEEAGINDPLIELTEPPSAASRWRSRRRLSNG
jgi:hypothetical protein